MPQDFCREMFEQQAGVKFIKVPFPQAGEAIPALLGGHVDISFAPASEWAHLYRGGKVNVLAVSTEQRDHRFPNIPTFREFGYDITINVIHVISAPAGTPDPIINFLAEVFRKASSDPGFVEAADQLGATAAWKSPEDSLKALDEYDEIVGRVLKKYGLTPQ